MVKDKKLSVIVPVYNAKDYLDACVESILSQSFQEIEVLLIDDGSTDGSGDICDWYARKDRRIKVFHKKNSGLLLSRKFGVEKASGIYVTFVDADDFISCDSYGHALKDMQKGIEIISFDIIRYFGGNCVHVSRDKYKAGIYDTEEIRRNIYQDMIWDEKKDSFGMDPSLCSKIIKRELLKKQYSAIGDMNFHYGEDVAVIYPLILQVNSLSIHHEAYYYHRQRETANIAPCLTDDMFFDKLYDVYQYLRQAFGDSNLFKKQIDLFYMKSVQLKGRQYGKIDLPDNKIFPFDKVSKGERIVLYGAGNIGKLYRKQLALVDYCEVVLWVDKNYKQYGNGTEDPLKIRQTVYDKVVIAVEREKIREEMKKQLIEMGVSKTHVV